MREPFDTQDMESSLVRYQNVNRLVGHNCIIPEAAPVTTGTLSELTAERHTCSSSILLFGIWRCHKCCLLLYDTSVMLLGLVNVFVKGQCVDDL